MTTFKRFSNIIVKALFFVNVLKYCSVESYGTYSRPFELCVRMFIPYTKVMQNIDVITQAIKANIAKRLLVDETIIYVSTPKRFAADSSYVTFGLDNSTLKVWDSLSTPVEYSRWQTAWSVALLQGSNTLTVPADSTGSQLTFDIDGQYNNQGKDLYWINEASLLEAATYELPSGGPPANVRNYLSANPSKALQFSLKQNLDSVSDSYLNLDKMLKSMASMASTLLDTSSSSFLLLDINENTRNSVIFQFIMYPSSKPSAELAFLWKQKVENHDPLILQTFPTFDFDFPPLTKEAAADIIGYDTTTKAPTPSEKGDIPGDSGASTAGIVVGSVCGAVAGIALLGAGGYYVKRKMNNNNTSPSTTEDEDDPGEDSDGEVDSPARNHHPTTP